jgi:hypothetical protein
VGGRPRRQRGGRICRTRPSARPGSRPPDDSAPPVLAAGPEPAARPRPHPPPLAGHRGDPRQAAGASGGAVPTGVGGEPAGGARQPVRRRSVHPRAGCPRLRVGPADRGPLADRRRRPGEVVHPHARRPAVAPRDVAAGRRARLAGAASVGYRLDGVGGPPGVRPVCEGRDADALAPPVVARPAVRPAGGDGAGGEGRRMGAIQWGASVSRGTGANRMGGFRVRSTDRGRVGRRRPHTRGGWESPARSRKRVLQEPAVSDLGRPRVRVLFANAGPVGHVRIPSRPASGAYTSNGPETAGFIRQ